MITTSFTYNKYSKHLDTQKTALVILKLDQWGFTKEQWVKKMQTEWQIV